MLAFFPNIYKDELLYSAFARYHLMSGNLSPKETLIDLFGTDRITSVLDLPSHLDDLCRNIPDKVINADYLIDNHTIFPYFSPFLPFERVEKIRDSMKGHFGNGIHMRIGIMASGIKTPRFLKYCKACYIEDEEQYGSGYWHISNQLPGVLICPKHNNVLLYSTVVYSRHEHQFKYVPIDIAIKTIPSHQVDTVLDAVITKNWDLYVLISAQTKSLLNNNFNSVGLDSIKDYYNTLLQKKGFADSNGRIRFKQLIRSFSEFYSKDLLQHLYSIVDLDSNHSWLHKLLRKPRVSCHPLRHILLLAFLGETVDSLIQQTEQTNIQNIVSFSHVDLEKQKLLINGYIPSAHLKIARRRSMLRSLENLKTPTKQAIRNLNSRDFMWLYKNDKPWLYMILPPNTKCGERVDSRIDWKLRDKEIVDSLKKILGLMLIEEKPVRITIGTIGLRLGKKAIIKKHINKLPLTKKNMDQHVETTEQFQIRRLHWAANQLLSSCGQLKGWKLLKKAGIPTNYSPVVQQELIKILENHDKLFVTKLVEKK
ncbi:TnsD family Tn7-like transposition protein [Robertmurraya sp.]|uniref:TnsD family Tn7-like transposition protein n=1 Tax=Robertmurraya sp. TaxID=2837525 RepID=UPI0037045C24